MPTCKSKHKLVFGCKPIEIQKDECSYCYKNIKKSWTCLEKDCSHKRWLCSKCHTDYFVRWKLSQKTASHHFYTTSAIKSGQDPEASFNQEEFYDTVDIEKKYASDSETFVLIRFWRKENYQMECYT